MLHYFKINNERTFFVYEAYAKKRDRKQKVISCDDKLRFVNI